MSFFAPKQLMQNLYLLHLPQGLILSVVVILYMILTYIPALLGLFNMPPLSVLKFVMLSTGSISLCITHPPLIRLLLRVFFNTLKAPFTMAFTCTHLRTLAYLTSLMLVGSLTQMTVALNMVFSLYYRGNLVSWCSKK